MTENALARRSENQALAEDIERVLVTGDLARLTPEQRVSYYMQVCQSLRLNPYTKPFEYITLNGKLVLYARKDATEQLRRIQEVSITKLEREKTDGVYIVTAYAQDKNGRTDSSIGAVNVEGLKGEALANAYMKAETKSKRRVTLSICGLGMLDETEVETIPGVKIEPVELPAIPVADHGNSVPRTNVLDAPQGTQEPRSATQTAEVVKDAPAPETAQNSLAGPSEPHGENAPLVYTGKLAKLGKNLYPMQWGRLCSTYQRANVYEVDGILQKLALPQDTKPEDVITALNKYLDAKA